MTGQNTQGLDRDSIADAVTEVLWGQPCRVDDTMAELIDANAAHALADEIAQKVWEFLERSATTESHCPGCREFHVRPRVLALGERRG